MASGKDESKGSESEQSRRGGPLEYSAAAKKFLASMIMDCEKWKEGIGYDLEVLKKLKEEERDAIGKVLREHEPRDWRDIEALAVLGTPGARREVEAALNSRDAKVRHEAMRQMPGKVDSSVREKPLIEGLKHDELYGGLSEAIDEAEGFHPPAVIDALFEGALNRDGEAAVHFAALLYFIHGKAKEAFDWDHRPFFLQFHTTDRAEREAVFRELCAHVGVDPAKYLQGRRQ